MHKNKIQAVIFDMDGLMFDTESLFSIVHTEMAKKRGKEFTLEIKGKIMGLKPLHVVEIILQELGIDENPEEVLKEQNTRYLELLKNESQPMPGLFELLNFLDSNGLRRGIATSSMREWVGVLLNRFKIENNFDFIVTGDDIKLGKPNPEIYLKVTKALDIPPSSCLVLEDSSNGIRAAKSAGCFAVAVPSKFTLKQDFSDASIIIDSLLDKKLFEILV